MCQKKKKNISEFGVERLIDAIFWRAIVDVVDGWRKNKTLKDHSLIRDVNYCTAMSFLRSNVRGQRILNILENLDDEQRSKLLEEGGLASSYVTGN